MNDKRLYKSMMDRPSYPARVVMDTSEYPTAVKPSNYIELLVTNIDQRTEHYETKKIIGNLFRYSCKKAKNFSIVELSC